MGQSIFEKIQSKLELFRLEKRYTRSRHRRSAFVSNAIYVDGEYIYQTPNSTGSSATSSGSRIDALHGAKPIVAPSVTPAAPPMIPDHHYSDARVPSADRKRMNRFSSMPGFGGSYDMKPTPRTQERRLSLIR